MSRLVLAVVGVGLWSGCSDTRAPEPEQSLERLTARLVELDEAYWKSDRDPDIARELVEVAATRAPLWERAVREEPVRALAAVVPQSISVALPFTAAPYVEEPYANVGEVESTVADDLVNHRATYELRFGDIELVPVPGISRPHNGERFDVHGYRHGDLVLVERAARPKAALAGIVWGSTEKVLAVKMSYTDKSLTISTSTLQSALTGTASYYSTISNGTVTLTSTIVGTYTADIAATCNFSNIQLATMRVLAAAGVTTDGYNQIVAVVPDKSCGYTGESQVGQAQTGRATFSIINDTTALTHELGHAHGLYHAHALSCPGSDLASDESTCTTTDYGHPTDIMGAGGGSFDAFGLEALGYLGRSGFGMPTVVTTSGSYSVSPLTGTASNTRLLKIPYQRDSSSGWTRSFYVEYHVATGLEGYISATNLNHKVFVTLGTQEDDNKGYFLKAIGTGESFTAPNGTVITVTAADDTSASVSVTMPAASSGCTRATPSILLLQQSIETPTTAGSTTQYAIQIWNKDSTECGPSKFAISSSDIPSGWTIEGTDILAYGGSGIGNGLLYVTSPASATGSTSFTVTANDASVSGHSKSSTLTYVVSTCSPVTPTVSLLPASGMTIAAGSTANYLLSFTNNNDAACGNSAITEVTGAMPSGWSVTPESSSFSVAAGSTVTKAVTVAAPASATGTNTIGAYLRYFVNAHSYYTYITAATATVSSACTHTPPQITISPSSQTSLSVTQLDYTVTVKNLDGPNCASTAPNTISLAVAPPSGITATLDASSVSLAQGATGTTTLHMTPTTSTPGDYVATVTATLSSVSSSAKATYKLSCGSITGPTVTMTPSTQQGQPGDTLQYGVTVKNPNTSTLCGSRTYSLTSTVTNLNGTTGWTTSLATSTMTLASGESASTTLYVTSPLDTNPPWAVFKPTVTATDDLGNQGTKAVFYSIQCVTNPPALTLSPASASTTPGSDVPITVTIADTDTRGCPWTMTMGSTLPNGWTESTLPSQITLTGGQSTTVTWTPHVPSGAADGTYAPKMWIDNAGIGSSATASVTVACTHAAPTVTLDPTTQTGAAGTALTYTATIKNNDASTCASQSFSFASVVPPGWTGDVDVASTTIAPGATTTTTLTATPPSSASGTNSVGVTATGAKSGAATGNASYVVTCSTAKPTVSLSPSTQTATPGTALLYSATITNKNSGCADETIAVATSLPNGWSGSVSSPSVTLASGASTTVTLSATAPVTASGTNSVGVKATSVAGATTGSASYVVTCTRSAPGVSLSPSSQSGAPGTAKTYTATIQNNDSGCASGTFTLTKSLPNGWSGSVSSGSVVLAPAATTTVTLSATPPQSASGTNSVGVTASNASSGATTGNASFDVTCTHAAPSVSLSPSSQTSSAGGTLTYTATVTNNDSGCASEVFDVGSTVPGGWSYTLSVPQVTLVAGATATPTVQVTSSASATGSNSVSVNVSNGTSGTASGSATYVVSTACVHNAPTVTITPSTQGGPAGTAVGYTVSVTNNDTGGCASNSFTLSRTIPAMPPFTGTFSSGTLTLAVGATGTSTLTVTSPSMVMPGSFSISATATSSSSGAATANATYVVGTACARTAPTVSISPSSQSAVGGTALAYTVTVTNKDSSTCATNTFTMTPTVDSGWTGTFSPSTLTLAPNASSTTTFTVTSAAAATPGSFTPGATATSASSGSGSGSATYVVLAPCVPAAPTVALSPSSQSAFAGVALAYTVTVTNNDSANCATNSFALTSTVANGWSGTFSSTPLSLAPGAQATSTLTVTSAGAATPGSYSPGATATSATSGAGSGTATYVVLAPCVRSAPTVALSPSSQSAFAGGALAYTVTVTNNDSATCATNSFALTSTVAGGWSGSFSTSPLSLAPGAQTTSTLTVTSAAAATAGSYSPGATATSATSGSGSASATYVVLAPCVRSGPTVAVSPPTQSALAGTALGYTVTVTNNDSANCATNSFALTSTVSNGWSGSFSATQLSLAPGAQGTTTLTVTSSVTAPSSSYSPGATATSAASGSGSGSATYVVLPCARTAPTVALSPSTQTGTAGSALAYTVTVTNNDAANCASNSFTLDYTVPATWSGGFSQSPLSLAPGAQGTSTLTVTSSPSATLGGNTISASATSGASGTSSASASYVVTPPCVRTAPTVTVSPSIQSGIAGDSLAYTATVTNHDSAPCGTSSFDLTAGLPGGWNSTLSASQLSLAPGASGSSTWTVTSSAGAVEGDNAISMSASSASSGSGSVNATFTVLPACVRSAPSVTISPLTQSGTPGTLLTYTATIKNQDAACGSSTFSVTAFGPGGWTSSSSSSSVTLGSGASTTLTLSVTSAGGATPGTFTAGISATSAASGTGSASTSYVVVASCVRAAPSVTLAPATQTSTAGGTLIYTATVTNNDAACGNTSFAIGATGPASWTMTAGTSSLALASGASSTVSISATSALGASASTYGIDVSATSGTSGTGAGSASYVVSLACTHVAPTVAVTPSTNTAAAGTPASYTVTVTNNDSGCSPGSFALTSTLPPGWSATYSATPLAIAAGSSGSATWTVTSSIAATVGNTNITAVATDGNSGAGSGSATYVVTAPCVRGTPTVSISPASQSGLVGSPLTYSATITNTDSACPSETFTFGHSEPTTFTGSLSVLSAILAPGATKTVTYSVTPLATAPLGNSTLHVTASGVSGAASGTATATVTPVCTRHAPTVSLTPSSQTGTAGAPLVFDATITNEDVACIDSTIIVAVAPASGWTATAAKSSVILASGISATVAVTITSPLSAVGSKTFDVTATASASGSGAATGTVTIACNHAPASIVLSPSTQSADAGGTLEYTAAVTNASTGCADETFSLQAAGPDGWEVSLVEPSLTLATAASGSSMVAVTSPDSAMTADETVTVTASSGQSTPASATATYHVNGGSGSGSHDGCDANGSAAPWWLVVLGLAGLRRRRRA